MCVFVQLWLKRPAFQNKAHIMFNAIVMRFFNLTLLHIYSLHAQYESKQACWASKLTEGIIIIIIIVSIYSWFNVMSTSNKLLLRLWLNSRGALAPPAGPGGKCWVLPAAFRAGATSSYSRWWVLFLSNTRKISWGEVNQNTMSTRCQSHRGVVWLKLSHRPPPDLVPQTLELQPVQLSFALSLDETLRSKKLNSSKRVSWRTCRGSIKANSVIRYNSAVINPPSWSFIQTPCWC